MNLEFFVCRRKLTRKGVSALAADTLGVDTFSIEFDREWDGLVKIVELKNGDAAAQVIYTGKMPLPRQVCGRGDLYLTCHGYRSMGDAAAVVRTLPMVRPVRMAGASPVEGSGGQPYTPSAFDQMAAQVAQAQTAAQAAREAVRELRELQATGAFTGPAGPAATIRVAQVRQGAPAAVENLGTEHHAILRFTLPYGLNEEEKQALAEEIGQQVTQQLEPELDEIIALQQNYMEQAADGEAVS